jgi:hypothetical protein
MRLNQGKIIEIKQLIVETFDDEGDFDPDPDEVGRGE